MPTSNARSPGHRWRPRVFPNGSRAGASGAEAFARVALAAAFLSAVASRVGLWSGTPPVAAFDGFVGYAAEVLAFVPDAAVRPLAWAATVSETTLGVLLLAGVWPRPVAFAAAALLTGFGLSMAVSLGPKEPLDYSVFSAAACALLLATRPQRCLAPGGVSASGD